ncbi:MAG: sarcosine oxidase subunit delta [Rhodobacteraceae bacterium]|nr:sarcosine oxidase subunit delta [Paracoccaceae bacterium]
MQIFPCPFCGPREEHEFLFAAEAGKVRPEPAAKVSDEEWAAYLYHNDAPKGIAREIWYHQTCGTYFLMTRETVTREVKDSRFLSEAST